MAFIVFLVVLTQKASCLELFKMIDNKEINQNTLLHTLKYLPLEYEVSFNFCQNAYLSKWTSVIHLTIGNDLRTYGTRTPAMFVAPSNTLYFASDIRNQSNYELPSNITLSLNEWIQVIISQKKVANQYIFTIKVANNIIYSLENTLPASFSNVKVYMSDPWYSAQSGFINNLVIVGNPSGKPVINARISGQLTNTTFLNITTTISYAYETSPPAYELTWEYMLPYFSKISSQSGIYLEKGSIYSIPGVFVTSNVNQYISITLEMTCCLLRGDLIIEIPLKISFNDMAGNKFINYTSFKTAVQFAFISNPVIKKEKSALEESYSRGICWDQMESLIYACLNLYVTTKKTACYVSNNYGEIWKKLDIRVGSVLGYHILTRDLYVIHRNQKTYLMYNKLYRKWLVVPTNEFKENVSKNLNLSACLKLEETYEQILTLETLQLMGNDEGLFFRKDSKNIWIARIKWKELQ